MAEAEGGSRASGDPATRGVIGGGGGALQGRKWENFSCWACCVCVVTFDLELGQALETIIPVNYQLSDTEKSNICYLAFPDSNSGCMGDTQFHFKIRCTGSGTGGTDFRPTSDHNGAPRVLMPDSSYYYGFVYFRQVKDSNIKRGYFQKSVVLVTRLPYIALYNYMIQKIAPEYFSNGIASLEAACYSMDQWPSPRAGQQFHLPLLGQLLYLRLPTKSDKPGTKEIESLVVRSSAVVVIPSVHELNLYQALQPVLNSFELIWELVITNEPILVMGSSPTLCANTVQALVSLIHPLKFAADFRPFFTIHDSEFKHYTTKTQAPPSVILGVTNPFFTKTLDHWPHIVRLGDCSSINSGTEDSRSNQRSRSPGDMADSRPGVFTRYKPFLQKDKTFAKLVISSKIPPGKRPMEVQNVMVKKHALELTTSFIIPLERYLASLMPLKRDVSPWRPPPQLKPFDVELFLKGMEGSGPHLTSGVKGNWPGLYRRFLNSVNFKTWFSVRREEANQKLRLIHLDMLCRADIGFWLRDKQEVEIVDFLILIKDTVTRATQHYPSVLPQTLKVLESQIRIIISRLPEDLQSCLKPAFITAS